MLTGNENKYQGGSAKIVSLFFLVILAGIGIFAKIPSEVNQSGTDQKIEIVRFEPTGRTDTQSNITIEFSRDIVPEDSLDKPVLKPPFKINPPVEGIARWIEKNIIRFYPDNEFQPATEYTVRIKSDRALLYDNKLRGKTGFEFHTPQLAVLNVREYFSSVGEPVDHGVLKIDITFNYPVDPKKLKKRISIKGKENAEESSLDFEVENSSPPPKLFSGESPGSNNTEQSGRKLTVTTEKFLQTSKTQYYLLEIEDGLVCDGCLIPMSNEFLKTVRVNPKKRLVINYVHPQGRGMSYNLQINFSQTVDIEEIGNYLGIKPDVGAEIEQRYNTVILRGDFKPRESYEITIAEGMPSISGPKLEREFSTIVSIPDLAPSVRFTSNGIFLPDKGEGLIEIETVNIDKLSVEVEEIFANNIVYFLAGGYGRSRGSGREQAILGRSFFIQDYDIEGTWNEKHLTTVDLAGIIGDRGRGIFKITVRNKNRRWTSDSRYAMLTDIGITARMAPTYLMVWVNSLENTRPLSGAEVKLISRNNQIIVEGTCDERGVVIIDDIVDRVQEFEPYVVVVTCGDDLAYLQFDQCRLPISDFDVGGRPYSVSGYEAFVCTDRGIYRPGDTVHIVSIVRGPECSIPDSFPFLVTVYDPQGNEFRQIRGSTGELSFTATDIHIPDFARTGNYTMSAHIGDTYEIGRAEFLVEEFMPDRIRVGAEVDKDSYSAGETMFIKAGGKFLFGPPSAGHNVSGHITIEKENFTPKGRSQYTFNEESKKFARIDINLPDTVLDESGRHLYRYDIASDIRAPSMLKALVSVTISEQGGRAVSGYNEVRIFPYEYYIGLRLNLDGYARPDVPIEFDMVALDRNGGPAALDSVQVKMYRLAYHTILRKDENGYYRYVSEETVQPFDSVCISIAADGTAAAFTPHDYGRYRIVATDLKGGHSSSIIFYVSGWGYTPWAMVNPDRIELGLDKDKYIPGEKAKVQVRAPFEGRLLMTVERDRILEFITADMEENTAEIEIPVKKDYFPNVYITATVIKRADKIEKNLPARAFGMMPLVLSNKDKQIGIDMQMPEEIKPNSKLIVEINIDSGKKTRLALALVDAGILQLTDFITPDPVEFFHGRKRPYLNPYDIYSFVFPDLEKHESHLSPAGGRMFAETRKRHLNPVKARRMDPVALWSGIIETDDSGRVLHEFDIPQFNGSLRAMIVAVDSDRFGSAEKTVIVRDRIVIQESFPRFAAPNDVIEGLVTVFNNTGNDTDVTVELNLDGPIELISPKRQVVRIADNAEGDVVFKFRSGLTPGKIKCTISAFAGSDKSEIEFEMPNRPAQPLHTEYSSGVITEERPAEFTFPGNWVPGTDKYILKTSSLPAVGYVGNIEYLLRYPYGCVEQTTSKLFPLLYFNALAKFLKPELVGSRGSEYYIQEGIPRLLMFMNGEGGFSFWPGKDRINSWASVYASHFMIEAQNAGYYVDKKALEKIYKNLKNILHGRGEHVIDNGGRIYAAYVLARSGKLDKKGINYLKGLNPDAVKPYSRYQAAGALALAGETDHAAELIPLEIHPNTITPETGGNFSSPARTDAILLDVLLDVDPQSSSIPVLAQLLMENSRLGKWYTTQETAFALMALGRYFKNAKNPDFTGHIKIFGDTTYRIDTSRTDIIRDNLGGKTVTIDIQGDGNCYYYWQAGGVSTSHAPEEFERGIKVSRTYFDENGAPIDPENVVLGDQIVCCLTATATDKNLSYVVINDLIPAGFEIENPRLKTTPQLSWIPSGKASIDYQDIRDDRLLLFVDLRARHTVKFYYSLRAICAGEFVIPPVAAECMYNPLIAGSASSGRLKIRGR